MLARSQCELDIRRCGVRAWKFYVPYGRGRLKERRARVCRSSIDGNRKLGGRHDEEEEGWLHPPCTCARVRASLCTYARKRIAAWRTRNRGRTMVDPFNYPRDSTRRRKQAPSRIGRCAAQRTVQMTINSANISSRTNYLGAAEILSSRGELKHRGGRHERR